MWNLNVKTALGIPEKECCYNLLCCRPVASSWSSWSSVWSAWSASSSTSPSAPMPWHQAWREASSWCLLMTSKHSCLDCFAKLLNLVTGFLIYVTFNCGKMCNKVIKDPDFLQDVKSREREQWARDFDKVIQHPRIVESMFVQKWWTQRFFAAETETARNCKVTVCNQLLLLSSNAEIHVREALEWLFSYHD